MYGVIFYFIGLLILEYDIYLVTILLNMWNESEKYIDGRLRYFLLNIVMFIIISAR